MIEKEALLKIHQIIHSYLGLPFYEDMTPYEMIPFALAVHEIVNRYPVTMRSRKSHGVRVEDGKVIDNDYTGPVLEEVLKTNRVIRTIPETGAYKGTPVVVAPIRNERGEAIAAIGVVDLGKILNGSRFR